MSAVRPEFGPTLPELLVPRARALSRRARLAVGAVASALVAAVAWVGFIRDDGHTSVVIHDPVTFNFSYDRPVAAKPLRAGEIVRIGFRRQSMTVREFKLPPYRGEVSGFLPVYATTTLEPEMARRFPGFVARYEGRSNVNRSPGYEIAFQYREGTRQMFGRRIVMFPNGTARTGLDVLLLSPRSAKVRRPEGVGRNDALRQGIFSFRLGTEPA